MKWNQKGIIACVVLFFVIIGALMVQGVQKTNNQEDAHYASEEEPPCPAISVPTMTHYFD